MVSLFVTEGKSVDPVRFFRNRVRIFLDGDLNYGLWIDEDQLFELLDLQQKRQYLTAKSDDFKCTVTLEVARNILSLGYSPYPKKLLPDGPRG